MADQIYLSLWFPNFRLESLPGKLVSILQQFARAGGSPLVCAATVYPISWNEAPVYQRIYSPEETAEATPEEAVAAATAALHDDFAFEFEVSWPLWIADAALGFDSVWREEPRTVRVIGLGPQFDEGAYEQNGHVRIDFGTDTPFVEDEVELDRYGTEQIQQNLQRLLGLTHAIEQHCAIDTRLLWSESGESLVEKLISRLQRLN